MADRRVDLTSGPVMAHVWRMTPPMVVGLLAMMAFNLVDTWFVSKLGTDPLAAMGFTFPVVMIVYSVAMGIGLGVSSCVSRAIGAGDHGYVQHLTTYALLLTFLLMSLCSAIGLLWLPKLLVVLGARTRTLPLASAYMVIWFSFVPVAALPMVGNNAIRATGDALRPSIIMGVVAIANAVLDPILIFGLGPVPALGMRGAALATGLARLAALAWSLWVMHHQCRLLTLEWRGLRYMIRCWGDVLHIGLPSAGTNLLMPISMGIVTRLIARHGEAAVAATAAGQRLAHFSYLIPMAMGASLVPIIGQNWGAGCVGRVREVWAKTNGYGVIYGLVCLALVIPLGPFAARRFSEDPVVIDLICQYLVITLAGAVLLHAFVHTIFAFNAIKHPLAGAVLIVVRFVVLVIPLSWLGDHWFGVQGTYAGMALATALSGLLAIICFRSVIHRAMARGQGGRVTRGQGGNVTE